MSDIFPEKRTWNQFLESCDPVVLEIESAVSSFVNPARVAKILLASYAAFVMACATGLSFLEDVSTGVGAGLSIALIVAYPWIRFSRAIFFGLNFKALKRITFGGLVQRVTGDRRRHVKTDGQVFRFYTREEIEQIVIKIISDVTATKMEKVTLDKTLVRDLRMG